MKYNVYDFDKTIYTRDSTFDFYRFCLGKTPGILVEIPATILSMLRYFFGMQSKTQVKETFFRFLRHLDDVDKMVDEFWGLHESGIASFYRDRHGANDIIASASPEFLLAPMCRKMEIAYLVGSKVNKRSGRYEGENCWGAEKRKRVEEIIRDGAVYEFYSDSLSDEPTAKLAEKAYLVRHGRLTPWPSHSMSFRRKMQRTFQSREFLLFVFCGGIGTLTNFVCSIIISLFLNATMAYVFGYMISLFVTYALNAGLIYKEALKMKSYMKFIVSYLPNFAILFAFVFVFLNFLQWNKVIVYALAGLLGLPITYILVKVFAFNRKESF